MIILLLLRCYFFLKKEKNPLNITKLNLFSLGGAKGPDILPPLLVVVCCLPRYCPCVPCLSVSLLLHSATPGCFGSASVSLPLGLPSKGYSTVVVHFFPHDMSNPTPSLPCHLLAYRVCTCHPPTAPLSPLSPPLCSPLTSSSLPCRKSSCVSVLQSARIEPGRLNSFLLTYLLSLSRILVLTRWWSLLTSALLCTLVSRTADFNLVLISRWSI